MAAAEEKFSIGGWYYGDYKVPIETLEPPLLHQLSEQNENGYFEGEVRHAQYSARCTLAQPDDIDSSVSLTNDNVQVGPYTFLRTRYRACCNPVFITWQTKTYILINTELSILTLYDVDTGAEVIAKIYAPEMMVAIYTDKNNPFLLHLFGWFWSPIEQYFALDLKALFSKNKLTSPS